MGTCLQLTKPLTIVVNCFLQHELKCLYNKKEHGCNTRSSRINVYISRRCGRGNDFCVFLSSNVYQLLVSKVIFPTPNMKFLRLSYFE